MKPTAYLHHAAARTRRVRWRLRPPQAFERFDVHCDGPKWFRTLIADEFTTHETHDGHLPSISWEEGAVSEQRTDGSVVIGDAFVSPRRSHPGSLRRLPPGCPSEFIALDAAARLTATTTLDRWAAQRRAQQLGHRAAHQRSLRSLLAELAPEAMPSPPSVEVVCVSCRPGRMTQVIDQFEQQVYPCRLTIVLSAESDVDSALPEPRSERVRILRRPGITLGSCLNEVIDLSDADLLAKWDDDDVYGPNYLSDLVLARNATGAAVTGKHSYFAYLARRDQTIVRFPGVDHRDTSFVAGGTLLLDRTALGDIRFPDINLGEDRALLRQCLRRGLRVYAADPFNYIQFRGDTNTWNLDDEQYARGALAVGQGQQSNVALV